MMRISIQEAKEAAVAPRISYKEESSLQLPPRYTLPETASEKS
jgi:hypothetical protein